MREVEQDTHHIFWPKSHYTGRLANRFRDQPAMKELGHIANHRLLHQAMNYVATPPMPTRQIMLEVNETIRATPVTGERFQGLHILMKHLEQSPDPVAEPLHANIAKQIVYLTMPIEAVEEEW